MTMNSFQPDHASEELERLMEDKDLPETDRDEVRRFAEFLRRRADFRAGKQLPPAPQGMKDWLLGKDVP